MEYKPHIVAFLDILGFSAICMKSEGDENERQRLAEVFELCKSISERFEVIRGKQKIKSMIVSDSIVLTLELGGESPLIPELANFYLACGQFQYFLAKRGFWLRGGISVGSLNVDHGQKQVVGPALIKAVNLEKKVARYPRIVVDPKIIADLGFTNASEFRTSVNELYADDNQRSLFEWRGMMDDWVKENIPTDVRLFIDFVSSTPDENDIEDIAKLIAHELHGPMEHYEKYRWLGDYILAGYRQRTRGIAHNMNAIKTLLG